MRKLITIDLWLTLIKSNPAYKRVQCTLIVNYMLDQYGLHMDEHEIKTTISSVSRDFDKFNESQSIHVDNRVRLEYVIKKLLLNNPNVITREVQDVNITSLITLSLKIDLAMLENPPLLIDQNVHLSLQKLIDFGYTLAVASNTGLQNGDVMLNVLEKLGLKDYFKHFLFSNETKYAKPALGMFRDLIAKPELKVWFHVGDNNVADNIGYSEDEEDSDWSANIIPINYPEIDFNNFGTIVNVVQRLDREKTVDSVCVINIEDEKTTTLKAREYSRFKHGSKEICEKYAEELSSVIATKLKAKTQVKNVLIYGAPYNNVPAASNFLVFDIIRELRRLIPTLNIQEGKIKRKNSYHGDYGLMSKEERRSVLEGEEFEFVTQYDSYDLAIFVDDIYITGSHEELILKLIHDDKFDIPFFMAYYAKLNPGCCEPQYESQLNQAALRSVNDNLRMLEEDIVINTRNCKYFLKLPSEIIETAIKKNPNAKIWPEILTKAVANDYSTHELYKDNFKLIQDNVDISRFN